MATAADDDDVPPVDEEAMMAMFSLAKKKKRRSAAVSSDAEPGRDLSTGWTYDEMLSRAYAQLHQHRPELAERTKKKIRPPQLMRVGTTRTAWVNFKQMCATLRRPPEHVMAFFLAELGTTGSVDGSDRLLMRGKFTTKAFESLVRKYIEEYVSCRMCSNMETDLVRDGELRLHFMVCRKCDSTRTVAPIKAGFHAVGKGERRRARNALPS